MEICTRHAGRPVHLLGYLADPTYPPLVPRSAGSSTAATRACPRSSSGCAPWASRSTSPTSVGSRRTPAPRGVRTSPTRWSTSASSVTATSRSATLPQPRASGLRRALRRPPGGDGRARRRRRRSGGARPPVGAVGPARRSRQTGWPHLQSLGLAGRRGRPPGPLAGRRASGCARSPVNLGLVVTGSSDYHGNGKVDHDLGCNTTTPRTSTRCSSWPGSRPRAAGRMTPRGGPAVSAVLNGVLLTEIVRDAVRDHGPRRHGPDLPVAHRRAVRRHPRAVRPGRRWRCRSW